MMSSGPISQFLLHRGEGKNRVFFLTRGTSDEASDEEPGGACTYAGSVMWRICAVSSRGLDVDSLDSTAKGDGDTGE